MRRQDLIMPCNKCKSVILSCLKTYTLWVSFVIFLCVTLGLCKYWRYATVCSTPLNYSFSQYLSANIVICEVLQLQGFTLWTTSLPPPPITICKTWYARNFKDFQKHGGLHFPFGLKKKKKKSRRSSKAPINPFFNFNKYIKIVKGWTIYNCCTFHHLTQFQNYSYFIGCGSDLLDIRWAGVGYEVYLVEERGRRPNCVWSFWD